MTATNDPLESYIGRLEANLRTLTPAGRQDIVDEIRAHVHERVASSGLSIPEVLEEARAGRGTCAGILSRSFNEGGQLRLLGCGRFSGPRFSWAVTAAHGVALLAVAFWGYGAALACFAAGLARYVFPEQIAIWITPDFEMGMGPDRPIDAQAFLDNWFQPLTFGLGILLLMLTTMVIRYLLPRLKSWRRSAMEPVGLPSLDRARSAASHLSRQFFGHRNESPTGFARAGRTANRLVALRGQYHGGIPGLR